MKVIEVVGWSVVIILAEVFKWYAASMILKLLGR